MKIFFLHPAPLLSLLSYPRNCELLAFLMQAEQTEPQAEPRGWNLMSKCLMTDANLEPDFLGSIAAMSFCMATCYSVVISIAGGM